MAIPHLSIRVQSRSRGQSMARALAYRCGLRLVDVRTGRSHEYSRRRDREEIAHTGIGGYAGLDRSWSLDNAQLLADRIDRAETRSNSIVARDFEAALPVELDAIQRRNLAQEWTDWLATRYRTPVPYAIHRPPSDGDRRNVHIHALVPDRTVEDDGVSMGRKLRVLTDRKRGPKEILELRLKWQAAVNRHLREAGIDASIDMSHTRPADRPSIHAGPRRTGRERRRQRAAGIVPDGRGVLAPAAEHDDKDATATHPAPGPARPRGRSAPRHRRRRRARPPGATPSPAPRAPRRARSRGPARPRRARPAPGPARPRSRSERRHRRRPPARPPGAAPTPVTLLAARQATGTRKAAPIPVAAPPLPTTTRKRRRRVRTPQTLQAPPPAPARSNIRMPPVRARTARAPLLGAVFDYEFDGCGQFNAAHVEEELLARGRPPPYRRYRPPRELKLATKKARSRLEWLDGIRARRLARAGRATALVPTTTRKRRRRTRTPQTLPAPTPAPARSNIRIPPVRARAARAPLLGAVFDFGYSDSIGQFNAAHVEEGQLARLGPPPYRRYRPPHEIELAIEKARWRLKWLDRDRARRLARAGRATALMPTLTPRERQRPTRTRYRSPAEVRATIAQARRLIAVLEDARARRLARAGRATALMPTLTPRERQRPTRTRYRSPAEVRATIAQARRLIAVLEDARARRLARAGRATALIPTLTPRERQRPTRTRYRSPAEVRATIAQARRLIAVLEDARARRLARAGRATALIPTLTPRERQRPTRTTVLTKPPPAGIHTALAHDDASSEVDEQWERIRIAGRGDPMPQDVDAEKPTRPQDGKQPPVPPPPLVDPAIHTLAELYRAYVSRAYVSRAPPPKWILTNPTTVTSDPDRPIAVDLFFDRRSVHSGRYTPRQLASAICLANDGNLLNVDAEVTSTMTELQGHRAAALARER